jgi:hypothetical protein
MPLFLADIHLDRAEARRLIFKHGYLRRKEEFEDAEGSILGARS